MQKMAQFPKWIMLVVLFARKKIKGAPKMKILKITLIIILIILVQYIIKNLLRSKKEVIKENGSKNSGKAN